MVTETGPGKKRGGSTEWSIRLGTNIEDIMVYEHGRGREDMGFSYDEVDDRDGMGTFTCSGDKKGGCFPVKGNSHTHTDDAKRGAYRSFFFSFF